MFAEFQQFIRRGNVVDLAVAVVIGAAFGKIVTSFVDDILMPPIGLALGNVDFQISLSICRAKIIRALPLPRPPARRL